MLFRSTKVIVTKVGHGYNTGDSVTIANASPTGYNGTFTITKIDSDNFSYALTSAPGPNTSTAVTASKNGTTARATSTGHGFSSGDSVTISGATPSAFNGTFSVKVIDSNTFTYTLGSAQGDATGTIKAIGTLGGIDRTDLINWVRGEDNAEDENLNASLQDIRASVHGDVLHSRPAVVNYNRYGTDNDTYVFYGSNDGIKIGRAHV